MDLIQLRHILASLIISQKDMVSHAQLSSFCAELGLPSPDEAGVKRERIESSFNAVADVDLPSVARRLLNQHPPEAAIRNQIQDILWSESAAPPIPKRFRREVARAIECDELYGDARKFDELLDQLWILDTDPWAGLLGQDTGLRAEIQQHVHRNPGDWSAELLFDRLGVYDASDYRFALFLEGLASADVRPDEAAQRRFVTCVNVPLQGCGVELRETDTEGGYPVFTLISLHTTPRGRPKNLIFASSNKPDLRFRDAIDNDIEIVTNADKVLVYDRPIGSEGLRWDDLQRWWSETENITETEFAKRSLYRRLRSSLPASSPPQRTLFDAFYEGYGSAVPPLPALLPEVWLHWDHRTVTERGRDALLRFRMDFLLLLPQGVRIVIEVDGKHHYADATGQADASRYARMVAADRELKLSGYEVFRFGATELQPSTAKADVKTFFDALFKRYGVSLQ
ncbi:hypothetical protein ACNQFN_06200 [Thauera butanivorans]|uniref:AbiJ-related protein n=1 Tax=Thauera butanivorans TaxID=86174 RepID=UPI003AB1D335